MNATPLNKLNKNELFRLNSYDKGAVFIKGNYDSAKRAFSCTRHDDINTERFIKSTRLVFAGFTY